MSDLSDFLDFDGEEDTIRTICFFIGFIILVFTIFTCIAFLKPVLYGTRTLKLLWALSSCTSRYLPHSLQFVSLPDSPYTQYAAVSQCKSTKPHKRISMANSAITAFLSLPSQESTTLSQSQYHVSCHRQDLSIWNRRLFVNSQLAFAAISTSNSRTQRIADKTKQQQQQQPTTT